ncbi:MAG TPA: ABC transporter permease [Candidatus Limnocylindrales bacterium]
MSGSQRRDSSPRSSGPNSFIRAIDLRPIAEPLFAILLALVVGAIGITLFSGLVPGHANFDIGLPIAAYSALIEGAAAYPNGWTSTLVYATPLILAGLGIALGFKAGLFNIGGRGQFLMGAVGSMAVATAIGPSAGPWITIPLALLVGGLFGAAAGFVPGFLKATSGAHEVVTTIMLNYIFVFATYWAISGPLKLPNAHQPITGDVSNLNASLPIVFGRDLNAGILLALVAVPIIWFLLYRTTLGFEIRAAGANPDAARYGGMRTNRLIVLTMSIAGFMSGLAGSTTLLGVVHQMAPGYDTTVGFDAITVALLGRSNPVGVLFAGVLLGAMRAGSQSMQIQAGVPAELVDALQAIILVFLVINVLRRWLRGRSAGPAAELSLGVETGHASEGAL